MGFNDILHETQTKPAPTDLRVGRTPATIERLKNMAEFIVGNT